MTTPITPIRPYDWQDEKPTASLRPTLKVRQIGTWVSAKLRGLGQ